jgi:hypothetical protein
MWMEMTSRMVVGGGLGKDDGVDDRANYGREARELRQKRKTRARFLPLARRGFARVNSLEKKQTWEKYRFPTETSVPILVTRSNARLMSRVSENEAAAAPPFFRADWCASFSRSRRRGSRRRRPGHFGWRAVRASHGRDRSARVHARWLPEA